MERAARERGGKKLLYTCRYTMYLGALPSGVPCGAVSRCWRDVRACVALHGYLPAAVLCFSQRGGASAWRREKEKLHAVPLPTSHSACRQLSRPRSPPLPLAFLLCGRRPLPDPLQWTAGTCAAARRPAVGEKGSEPGTEGRGAGDTARH